MPKLLVEHSGVMETLGAPRNLVRWGPCVETSLCKDFLLVGALSSSNKAA